MPLTRFDPPAGIDDLDTEPLRKAWSDTISSMINTNKASLQTSLGAANPAQFFNELTDPKNMADRVEQDIIWQGFPRVLEKQFGENTTAAFKHGEDDTPGATARKATQDEYLEWHVTHDNTPAKKIVRVEFTCESPEYWQFLAQKAPDKVIALYQKHVSATAVKADLFTAAGVYKPLNKWNTGSGVMHLIQPNNTLGAEVNIGAFATIKRKHADGSPVTDADQLIRCAQFGVAERASDPHIGDIVNGLARQGFSITIRNPIGLYIHKIDLTGFKKPDGTPITPAYFKITRGSAGQGLRAIFEVPAGETSGGHPFAVSDITIGGVKIAFGGQIAKRISIKLTGVAVEKAKINNPLFACIGPGFALAAGFGPVAHAHVGPGGSRGVSHPMLDPAIAAEDIQGNSLAGFNKDHQAFLLVRIRDAAGARAWLRTLVPRLSPLSEVQSFNELRRSMISRLGREPRSLAVTWINVALAARGVDLLKQEGDEPLDDDAFNVGLAGGRSEVLGDPPDRSKWKFGGADATTADVLVVVASDSEKHLRTVVRELSSGVKAAKQKLLFVQEGHTLEGDLKGHEHFGFRDGVSQPGVRGLTQTAKPGQPMIWPGQFVLGLPRQDDANPDHPLDPLPCPDWAKNGSFVVLRRLRQDIDGFWQTMKDEAARIGAGPEFPGIDPTRLASMLVGRWPSGAPFVLSPDADNPSLSRSNDFTFGDSDKFPPVCPFAAHIRKVNPRADPVEGGGPSSTLTRRFLRRGIPYTDGPSDRGLVFVSYQSSIQNQFEFVSRQWASREDLPVVPPGGGISGFDAIIGQNADGGRERSSILFHSTGAAVPVKLPHDFVVPTGGGYFFSPSISTLRRWSS